MERYVDGYVLAVSNDQLDDYREMADEAGRSWIEHGALEYFEGVGEEVAPETGGMPFRTFPEIAEAEEDESVVFAFVVFESRDHRDEVNAAVMEGGAMEDEEMEEGDHEAMPFDMERMAYGGFRSLVSYEN